MPDRLVIKSMNAARKVKRHFDAVISIEDPLVHASRKLRFSNGSPHPPHLVLRFEDVDHEDPELAIVKPLHVEHALAFAREHESGRILIHCHAGVCRSTAVAYAILCDRLGDGAEDAALEEVFRIRPAACPNILVTKVADRVLGRNRKMLTALERRITERPALQKFLSMKQSLLVRHLSQYAPASSIESLPVISLQSLRRRSEASPIAGTKTPKEAAEELSSSEAGSHGHEPEPALTSGS